ncbi:outer membrane beta-barrel protein [Psychrobacter sp. FDAARGOS_221]|uniref:outer membrane beta-barrel protein n=1 Tax=Psychrobacter sp. FDAARGOS_221 TaxID=1975705 RepID=UPI000BB58D7B|nr:outer membrane beta-barrel protein [Psychrobacter sp. FDAARGOS_221]PNK60733.1 porin family protein [Psychrobacter sp. FDAARGOS_221]
MKLLQKTLLALAAGSLMTVGAQAAMTAQPYIGAKVGYYDLENAKDEAFSYGGYLGMQFTPEVGLEAEYITTKKEDATATQEYKGENYGLYGTYKHHITGSNAYAKGRLGVAHNKVKLESVNGKRSESDTGIGGGLGFGYNFAPNAAVELAYEWYPKVNDVNLGNDKDVDAEGVTLGAHFKF